MAKLQPLSTWEDDGGPSKGVVWFSKLDNRYLVEVVRTGQYSGKLRIFDKEKGFECLLDEETGLSYGALFGPDISDVYGWQDRVTDFVDNLKKPDIPK
jgi:hypothetical protein